MSVPEAAVNEDNRTPAGKYEVGLTSETFAMQAVAKPTSVQSPAYLKFRFGVLSTDSRHVPAARLLVVNVSQLFATLQR